MEEIKKKRNITNHFIYKSEKYGFEIWADKYQYLLKVDNQTCYFPTLSLLLDELAERFFRKYTRTIQTFEEINNSIDRVYELIERVSKDFKEFP